MLAQYASLILPQYENVRYFVQDESRFGLKTLEGRKLTLSGVKPIGQWQWRFQAFWLYGSVEPLTRESFFWQFSHVDSECDQQFLSDFSANYPNSLNILQVDNGLFHKAKRLQVPDNIVLLFQPPYFPQVAACGGWRQSFATLLSQFVQNFGGQMG